MEQKISSEQLEILKQGLQKRPEIVGVSLQSFKIDNLGDTSVDQFEIIIERIRKVDLWNSFSNK